MPTLNEPDCPSPRPPRRLPTKTRSGVISLPPSQPREDDDEELASLPESPMQQQQQQQHEPSSTRQSLPSDEEATRAAGPPGPPSTSQPAQPARKFGGWGGPRQAAKPPSLTGPLNSSSTPQVQALPVKRRGSYQSLKRHAAPNHSNIESEDAPSVISLLKKSTHWEAFGTILVLVCARSKDEDGDGILQMLSAEGYDSEVCETQADATAAFSAREVFPDIVLIDSTHDAFNVMQMIKQLQSKNPTVAIVCLGSKSSGCGVDVVTALQGGAADFMSKPLDLDELVARIERHVQRQHCIKLELETALEDAKAMMAQVASVARIGDMMYHNRNHPASAKVQLISITETDFEQQIMDLSDENGRLGSKLLEMELHNQTLEQTLSRMDLKIDRNSDGVHGQIADVEQQNHALRSRVDELERMMQQL